MRKCGIICVLAFFISMFAGSAAVMAGPDTYIVKSGDCLWTISNSTGVSVETIKQLNNLSSELLHIDQVLIIGSAVTPVVQAPAAPAESVGSSSQYVICLGDNLWTIAEKYGTTVDNLKALNGLTSDALYAGDTLIVSGSVSGSVAAPEVSRSGSSISGSRIVAKAADYLGTPYRYGGAGPGGFDCSGFTSYIFNQFNISLSRTAAGQYGNGIAISKANLIPGDLVFFSCYSSAINHVGIYAGDGQFIHSSSPSGGGVIYSSLNSGYYANEYVGARRIIR